jgi:IS30 family transposase
MSLRIQASGGIRPTIPKRAARHLTLEDREEISRGSGQRHSYRQIGRLLRRPASMISREVAANGGRADYRATIYRTLHVQSRGAFERELTEHLRTNHRIRRPGNGNRQRASGSGNLVEAIDISQRPVEAEDRAISGHWEGDLILGKARARRWRRTPTSPSTPASRSSSATPRTAGSDGTNENTNGLLRQYFPKRTDLKP